MIDFSLSNDQKQLRDMAREFARNIVAPQSRAHDQSGEFPIDICRQAWELGLMNIHIPENFGGLGLTSLDGCLIAEELSAACSGIYTAIEANVLAEAPLIHAASDEQKKQCHLIITSQLVSTIFWEITECAARVKKSYS